MYVKADRLAKMGWKPVYTNKCTLLEALPEAIDACAEDMGWTTPEPQVITTRSLRYDGQNLYHEK